MAEPYLQRLDPLNNVFLSTAFAALPVLVLFWLLVPRRWLASKAGLAGAVVALAVAVLVYRMPPHLAFMAFVHGVGFGLLPISWTILNAMLLYNITVETGQFRVVRRSVSSLSGDARVQAVLIGFAFGAFLEGAAGAGTPVAICGAILVGLGFDPFRAAVLCLIANTSPVAYGGLGTPLLTLQGVTDIPAPTLSVMAAHQLPIVSALVPLYMVKCMCTWRQALEVWPVLAVAGGSFAAFQYTFATAHTLVPGLELYPMTDIAGGLGALVITALFLRVWRPAKEWHFSDRAVDAASPPQDRGDDTPRSPHTAEDAPLTVRSVCLAWAPWVLMSVTLLLTGLLRQEENRRAADGRGPIRLGFLQTNYVIPVPWLDGMSRRDARLRVDPERPEPPEKAEFNLTWLGTSGTAVFFASAISVVLLRMSRRQVWQVIKRTTLQMRVPIPTIALMLGLSYVTRYAGMDATLGLAFAATGVFYPFFAPVLGWLGVFLTGTDAGSNALFGSLQKITANEVFKGGWMTGLTQLQAQILICTANSTGGVMGKMIDAQSICVATAATNQLGREADLFKSVVWHSACLAAVIGVITLMQAYVWPFTRLVP